MVSKTEPQASRGDTLKIGIAVALVIAGIAGFYLFADQSLLMRVVGLLVVAAVAVAIGYQTLLGRRTHALVQEAVTETRKVVWPTRAETVQTTLVVTGMVIVVGLFLWLLDMFLGWAFGVLTGTGG